MAMKGHVKATIKDDVRTFIGGQRIRTSDLQKLAEKFQRNNSSEISAADIVPIDATKIMTSVQIAEAHDILNQSGGNVDEEIKAFEVYQKAAKRGNADGLFNVALMYCNGRAGLVQDYCKALKLCHEAASQKPYVKIGEKIVPNVGVAQAENYIAISYQEGLGVNQDDSLAVEWFMKSASHDCPPGQNNLGSCFYRGRGCAKSFEMARFWYEKAADFLHAEAQLNLATMLIEGQGGPIDLPKAEQLLRAAADQEVPGALQALQNFLRSGRKDAKSMTDSKKIVTDKADQRDKEALFLLGVNYLNEAGGFQKNLAKAEENFREAAYLGHPEANFALGETLLEQFRNSDAFEFIERSAVNRENIKARFTLGMLLAFGHGCKQDVEQGRRLLAEVIDADATEVIELADQVIRYEKAQKYSTEGMSVQDRIDRFIVEDDKNSGMAEELKGLLRAVDSYRLPKTCATEIWLKYPEMQMRAAKGSKTAQRFFDGMELLNQAEASLSGGGSPSEAFKLLRKSFRAWNLLPVDPVVNAAFHSAAEKAFDRNPRDAEALFIILRRLMLTSGDLDEQIRVAKRVVQLDPTVADYHHMLGCLYAFKNDIANSQRCVAKALDIDLNPDWLYDVAACLRLQKNHNPAEVISAYEKYLAASEGDARNVSEAYYCIALEYLAELNDRKKAEEFLEKAERAESPQIRLPCFGRVDHFAPKFYLKLMLGAEQMGWVNRGKGNMHADASDEGTGCGLCGKIGAMSRCARCKKVNYCGRDCQRKHWKDHKKSCN